jgi:hypothetical protein
MPYNSQSSAVYEASPIRRTRATKAEMAARRDALFEIVSDMQPMTVHQVLYQASVRGIVEKTDKGSGNGYGKVQRALVQMRRDHVIPYDWITDSTRWQRKPQTFFSIKDALESTAKLYRKALWADANAYVEFWLEKDALAGVVYPVTSRYDVPLMVARGYASLTFLHSAAEYIAGLGRLSLSITSAITIRPASTAGEKIEQRLREFAPGAKIYFERLAFQPWQIEEWELPIRPTKQTDTRLKNFGDVSVELDAIHPDTLRYVVQEVIERHLPREQFEALMVAEKSERQLLSGLVGMMEGR